MISAKDQSYILPRAEFRARGSILIDKAIDFVIEIPLLKLNRFKLRREFMVLRTVPERTWVREERKRKDREFTAQFQAIGPGGGIGRRAGFRYL